MYIYREFPLRFVDQALWIPSSTTATWFFANLCRAGSGITASSQNPYFPVSNILGDPRRSACWRSLPTDETPSLSIDFTDYGRALSGNYTPTDLLIDSQTWDQANANIITVQYWSGLPTPTLLYEEVLAKSSYAGPQWCQLNPPAQPPDIATVKLLFSGWSATPGLGWQYMEVSKLWIGVRFDTSQYALTPNSFEGDPDNASVDRTFDEATNQDFTQTHQSFSDLRASFGTSTWSLPLVGDTLEQLLEQNFWEQVGTVQPIWVLPSAPNYNFGTESGFLRYCKLQAKPKKKMVTYGAEFEWALPISIQDML